VFILGEEVLTLRPAPKISPQGNSMFALSTVENPIYYIGNPDDTMGDTAISRLCLYLPDTADTTSAVFAATETSFWVPTANFSVFQHEELDEKKILQVFNNIGIIMLDKNLNCYFSAQNLLCINPRCETNEVLSKLVSGYYQEEKEYNTEANINENVMGQPSLPTCSICKECDPHKIPDSTEPTEPTEPTECVWCPHWQKRPAGELNCVPLNCGFKWHSDDVAADTLLLEANNTVFNSASPDIVKTIDNKNGVDDKDGYVKWHPESDQDLCEGYIVDVTETLGRRHYPFSNIDPINVYSGGRYNSSVNGSRVYDGASSLVKKENRYNIGITFWNSNIPKPPNFDNHVGVLISDETYLDLDTSCPGDMERGNSGLSFNETNLGICSRNCPAGQRAKDNSAILCEDCPVGTYKEREGEGECLQCPAGQFQDSVGQTSCKDCTNSCDTGRWYTTDTCFEEGRTTDSSECLYCETDYELRTIGNRRYCFNQPVTFNDRGENDGADFTIGDVYDNGEVNALGSYGARTRVIGGQGYTWKLDKVHDHHDGLTANEFKIKKSHINECWVRFDRELNHQGRIYNQEDCREAPDRYFWAMTYHGHNQIKSKNSFAESHDDDGKPFYYILNSDASGEYARNQGRSCVKNVNGNTDESSYLTFVKSTGPAPNNKPCRVFQNLSSDKQCDYTHNYCDGEEVTVKTPGTRTRPGGRTKATFTTTCSTPLVSGVLCT